MIHVEHLRVGTLACNCTIVADTEKGEAVVVDGGDEVDRIMVRLQALNVRATHLVHTHAHLDHIGALGELRERTGARGFLHHADLPLYSGLLQQARWLGVAPPRIVNIDDDLRDGDRIVVGRTTLEVVHTPGHTPGSVSFALEREGRTTLLTGDTLFAGGVGRWDLGGTSLEDIVRSIRERLLIFPDASIVVPGHGPSTTIAAERASNPFLNAGQGSGRN
jgi:glyoxylase-like metal-dependent hydrolase (beta-lactamase superfamily II)